MTLLNKAVFLDRDGVINRKRDDYVKNVNEFVILEGVPEAIKLLNKKNFLVIVITNQSAVNRGLLTHEGLAKIHDFMKNQLGKHGAIINAIYYCPHRPEESCKCRKPKTELVELAIKEHSIDLKSSWFIGDSESDILTAKKIGIQAIKIENNSTLLKAIDQILKQ